MVKEKVQPEVRSGIGYSQADSYNNVSYAQQSYLNRPLSCAVDSAGDLIFADFNHRLRTWETARKCSKKSKKNNINKKNGFADFVKKLGVRTCRKTSGWATNCTVSGGFSFEQVRQYEAMLTEAAAKLIIWLSGKYVSKTGSVVLCGSYCSMLYLSIVSIIWLHVFGYLVVKVCHT